MRERFGALALAAACLAVAAASAPAAVRSPDLRVRTATATLADRTLAVTAEVQNFGRGAARPSRALVVLSADPRLSAEDVTLADVGVRRLGARRSARVGLRLILPVSLAPGRRFVVVCADWRRRVRERRETNNCRAAGPMTVPAPSPTPTATASPGPGPSATSSPTPAPSPSPTTTPTDADGDGVADSLDNCRNAPNPDQADVDDDDVGDACDPCPEDAHTSVCAPSDPDDVDEDDIPNATDNCPTVPNSDQSDADADAKGDVCDPCPSDANPGNQACPPPAPTLSGTNPDPPHESNRPKVLGTAPPGTTVTIYATSDCTGGPVGTGPAEQLDDGGIEIELPENADVSLAATAAQGDAVSACSNSIDYRDPLTLNETGVPSEADFCRLDHPASYASQVGGAGFLVFGRIYEAGVTEAAGPSLAITAEVGIGPGGSNPQDNSNWTWASMQFSSQTGSSNADEEYTGQLAIPGAVGTYAYTVRFSLDAGDGWTYCDTTGAGSIAGADFSPADLGVLTVTW